MFQMIIVYTELRIHNGRRFGYLRRDSWPTQPPCKGHTYKGPFHVMRMLAKCMQLLEEITA